MSLIRIALIGNCQVSALASVLRRSCSVDCRLVLDVNGRGDARFADHVLALHSKSDIDIALSQPISAEFDDISSMRLRNHFQSSFMGMTNIYFDGLHPDLSYFGSFGSRVASPLGDYHSKIALASYVQGMSIEHCLSRFSGKIYEKLGYLSRFELSAAELIARDEANELKFAAEFIQITKHVPTMLSVNHPTLQTTVALARLIEERIGGRPSSLSPEVCESPLPGSPVWPIYPEIAEHLRLPYETPFYFYPFTVSGRPLNLEDFVRASYSLYEQHGRERLTAGGAADPFLDLDIED